MALATQDPAAALAWWLYGPAPPPESSDTKPEANPPVLPFDVSLLQRRALVRRFAGSNNRARAYTSFQLAKKSGATRTIHAPTALLRSLQRRLGAALTATTARHGAAHGFEPERSIVTNAQSHVRKRWVYTVDIAGFFPSITWARVYGALKEYPSRLPEPLARLVANLSTYAGALPQGAPTSPILANLVCRSLDARLHRLARERGIVYTRYADDLTFSTNKAEFTPDDEKAIEALVVGEGFALNPEKRRLMPHSGRQMVTGLVVNWRVNVPKRFVKSLRALLHNIDRHGWESQTDRGFAFDSWAEWEAYRSEALSHSKKQDVQRRQNEENLLLNPRSRIPSVASRSGRASLSASKNQQIGLLTTAVREQRRQIRVLQRVVAGRLEFLRMVRGSDYPGYQHLHDQYRYLRSRSDTERTSYDEHQRQVRSFDPDYDDRAPLYRPFAKGKIERLSDSDFSTLLQERAPDVMEFGWLSPTDPAAREKAQGLAFRAYICSPRLTAAFAASFRERSGFEGLLHIPSSSSPTTSDIVAIAMGQVKAYKGRVPNDLYSVCMEFLEECQQRAGTEAWHPMTDDGFRISHVDPFKRAVRLDRVAPAFQLHVYLEESAQRANDARAKSGQGRVEVTIESPGRLFTSTNPVADALGRLIGSLVEKTTSGTPKVIFKSERKKLQTDLLSPTIYTITAPGTVVSGASDLSDQFGGDMRAALEGLRGYAEWTMSALFDDGRSYQFDVMRNKRVELMAPVDGATHTVTLYRPT